MKPKQPSGMPACEISHCESLVRHSGTMGARQTIASSQGEASDGLLVGLGVDGLDGSFKGLVLV